MSWPRLPVVLASRSPRRLALLRSCGAEPLVDPPASAEVWPRGASPAAGAAALAAAKAREVSARHAHATVVAADTTVWLSGRRFGRPRSRAHARSMLRDLAGREHEVWTGVAVAVVREGLPICLASAAARARVAFRHLAAAEVEAYLESEEPMDKAGAYALQGAGRALIERWSGDRDTVAGLSRRLLARLLAEVGREERSG